MTIRTCLLDGCGRPHIAKGLCRLHYDRQRRHGRTFLRPRSKSLTEHLWPRIEKRDEGCWIWTGALNAAGYGHIGHRTQVFRVHRVVYEMLVGPIPEGQVLDHLCRNRACCNPKHLEAVTVQTNNRRGDHQSFVVLRTGKCARGLHSMAEATVRPNGSRYCRACATAAEARRRARQKASAA